MKTKTVEKLLKDVPDEIKIFTDLYGDLVVRIHEIMQEKKMTQKELAIRLGKKPSEISRWLSGKHNFTLRSLAKLSAELGEPLLIVPKPKLHTRFVSIYRHSFHITKTAASEQLPQNIEKWNKTIITLQPLSNVG